MHIGKRVLSTAAVAVAMTAALVGAGLAQDATPTAMDQHDVSAPFPNHLHLGTCADFDPTPDVPLADLLFPEWAVALNGGDVEEIGDLAIDAEDFGNAPIPVAVATTEVAMPLADILFAGHALNVHNPASPDDAILCGNVGGVPDDRGDLFIGLDEVDGDDAFDGVAWFHDNGASTTVVVFLSHADAQPSIETALAALAAAEAEAEATPEMAPAATPVAEADATPIA